VWDEPLVLRTAVLDSVEVDALLPLLPSDVLLRQMLLLPSVRLAVLPLMRLPLLPMR
jgi:hypothetical protein